MGGVRLSPKPWWLARSHTSRRTRICNPSFRLNVSHGAYSKPLSVEIAQADSVTRPVLVGASLQLQVCTLQFPLDNSPLDVLGAHVDGGESAHITNGPHRLARIVKDLAELRAQAEKPRNVHRLVDYKTFNSLVSFMNYCVSFWPAAKPLLLRAYRAVAVRGGLHAHHVYGRVPFPRAVQADFSELPKLFEVANHVSLQPRYGALSATLGDDYSVLHHDTAGAPDGGAVQFYAAQPEGFRGGGTWMTVPGSPVVLVMTKLNAAMLDSFSSCVGEYCIANAHLDLLLPRTSRTVLEVLDNRGSAQAIVALKGHTPRMAELSKWRAEIMLRHGRRVVTVHRKREHLQESDDLSKGLEAECRASLARRGFVHVEAAVLSASSASILRMQHILSLPANELDDDTWD